MSELIDIVLLWVDGNDESWKLRKRFWQTKYGIINNNKERYRDWDNLKFLFRGIEKYASWVNHVFLVTDNQTPNWLDENYEKVTVIDHTEIIDQEFLPTFNANSIELNIHRIKNLSENFIYFNDDMFIINKITKEDFFKYNLPVDNGIVDINMPIKDQPIDKFIYNDLTLINDSFDKNKVIKSNIFNWFTYKNGKGLLKNLFLLPWKNFPGFHEPHLCVPYKKNTFVKVWDKYNIELLKTTKSKFRETHNYNQWLMRYWQLASNEFTPRKNNLGKNCTLTSLNSVLECCNYIKKQKGKIVCVNDGENLYNFQEAKNFVNKEFNLLFRAKSGFEK